MSAAPAPPEEFAWIERLRPLARGDPRALNLGDDAAVLPARPGHDLVISKDAMVEGVHFLAGERMDLVARRLLRTSLSDLAAKAAEPFGYFLMTAWPRDRSWADREAFIAGLAEDGEAFGVTLLGGDTVRTPGPFLCDATVLGWAASGKTVRRSGARAGDIAVVCGVIGDGWLGLKAAMGEISDPDGRLAGHYRTPRPLLGLRAWLGRWARAAADVSDGLLADIGHVARASDLGARVDLDRLPLSPAAAAWVDAQGDGAAARLALATGGDDYALVCALDPTEAQGFIDGVNAAGTPATAIGDFRAGAGVTATAGGATLAVGKAGWSH
jgi:thiamine-monophosphate kinase